MRKDVFTRVRRLLHKASYPSSKSALVDHIGRAGDGTDVVDIVMKFPDREYNDSLDALQELQSIESDYTES